MTRRFFRNESGVAATEFALMAPFLLMMLVGIIDYGMFINNRMRLENLAMAAAQYIVQGGTEGNIQADIMAISDLGITEDDYDIVYSWECSDGIPVGEGSDCGEDDYLREYVEVTVSKQYNAIIPLPDFVSSINLTGRVRLQNAS